MGYAWSQTGGVVVVALRNAATATPSFVAPETPGRLVFRLTVTDPGGLSALGRGDGDGARRSTELRHGGGFRAALPAGHADRGPAVTGGDGRRRGAGLRTDGSGRRGSAGGSGVRCGGAHAFRHAYGGAGGDDVHVHGDGCERGRGHAHLRDHGGGKSAPGAGSGCGEAHAGDGGPSCAHERAGQHRGAVCGIGAGERSDAGGRDGAVRRGCRNRRRTAVMCAGRPGAVTAAHGPTAKPASARIARAARRSRTAGASRRGSCCTRARSR